MDNNDIECLCLNGIIYLTNLTSLNINLESNLINSNGAIELGNNLIHLTELIELELNLKDNYIDNLGLE